MNLVDIIIIGMLILFGLTGFVRGFFKQTIIFIGTIFVIIFAFLLKNPISTVMYKSLPFLKFGGLSSLNILLYELIAFILMIFVLSIILSLIIKISGIVEKILDVTIILAIPSKILGLIVGLIQGVVILYVVLFIVSLPVFKRDLLKDSKYASIVLNNTPVMKDLGKNSIKAFDEIAEFTENKIDLKDVEETNKNIIEIMLKNNIVSTENIKYLVDNKKIEINNINDLISKYEEEK